MLILVEGCNRPPRNIIRRIMGYGESPQVTAINDRVMCVEKTPYTLIQNQAGGTIYTCNNHRCPFYSLHEIRVADLSSSN